MLSEGIDQTDYPLSIDLFVPNETRGPAEHAPELP
jgi:hypothetical protein